MDPPLPRPPGGGRGAGLRKQALMGAARTGGATSLLEEAEGGHQAGGKGGEPEQASPSGRSVELRPWTDYWDGCRTVELPGR